MNWRSRSVRAITVRNHPTKREGSPTMKQILITLTALLAPLSALHGADQAAPRGTVPGVTVSQGQFQSAIYLAHARAGRPGRGGGFRRSAAAGSSIRSSWTRWARPTCWRTGWAGRWPTPTTTVEFPAAGTYRVWVRTKDWVAPWKAPGAPGRFQVLVNGKPLDTTFGTEGRRVALAGRRQRGASPSGACALALHDLTGFEGRCDAILFATRSGSSRRPIAIRRWRRFAASCSACRSSRSRRASSIWSSSAAASPAPARRCRRRGWG